MNKKPEIKDSIRTFYEGIMTQLVQEHGSDYEGLKEKWLEIHEFYLETVNSFLEQWAEDQAGSSGREAEPKIISAQQAVVEITDRDTGIVFRRTLPLEYLETDNGIRLSGETIDGSPSHLAFLSETGLLRMKDILGKGPDSHRCQ